MQCILTSNKQRCERRYRVGNRKALSRYEQNSKTLRKSNISPIEQGAKVTAHYNSNSTSLHSLESQFSSKQLFAAQAELTSESSVESVFASAQAHFGLPVQILVVNHGIWPPQDTPIWEMELEQWKRTIDVNLTASFLVTKHFLRCLTKADVKDEEKQKANIVFVGSTAGRFGEKGHSDYAASKSGMYINFFG